MPEFNLLVSTKEALKDRPQWLTLALIHQDTGLPLRWLELFSQDRSRNPAADRVQMLFEYLTKNKLTCTAQDTADNA